MSDHAALQKRLDFYKKALGGAFSGKPRFKNDVGPGYLTNALKVDPSSLEKSAQFFELDPTHPNDLTVLAHLLANIVFGTRTPGRKKGDRPVWSDNRLVQLAFKYRKMKSRHPDWSDTEIAKRISQAAGFGQYRGNYEPIRQRLSKVKNMELDWNLENDFDPNYFGLGDRN